MIEPPGSDDRTVVGSLRSEASPSAPAAGGSSNVLPVGTRLGEFEITGVVGEGGFGIVYLAHDKSLERDVALKEYMPSSLASRRADATVSVKSELYTDSFEAGRRSFINEAKLLAHFDHPALVKVHRFWEANGTAYMVMPFYQGITLKQALKDLGAPPTEAWLKKLLKPLMEALGSIHRENCFHRDIAPDNILILPDGNPVLLDFGAARRVVGDKTQALTVILKPGFAPVEQYAEVPGMKQGAWTDVYALAAVLYYAISGKPPPPSVGRLVNDTLAPLTSSAAARYSAGFLKAIEMALAVNTERRPQTMEEFWSLLNSSSPDITLDAVPAPAAATAPPRKSGALKYALAGIVVALAAAVAAYLSLKPAPAPTSAAAPVAPVLAAAAPAAPKSFDPVAALENVFANRDRAWNVFMATDAARIVIGKDKLHFRLRSAKAGYLYLLMVGSDRNHFFALFPNALDGDNRVEPDRELALPRPGWALVAGGPPGVNTLLAIVSEYPRDFAAAGLKAPEPFAEFPLVSGTDFGIYAGKPKCPAGQAGCSASYGAAILTIEEVAEATASR